MQSRKKRLKNILKKESKFNQEGESPLLEGKMKNVDEFTKKSIERELKIQEIKGKKTFKDIWIGDGWLSKNKQGTITFKPVKY